MTPPRNNLTDRVCDLIEWRVLDFCQNYEVSEYGDVRNRNTGKILVKRLNRYGYLCSVISLGTNKKVKNWPLHKYVSLCFMGKRSEGMQINHKDGVKTNNHYSNLEYCSPGDNTRHAWRNDLCRKRLGEDCSTVKLRREDVVFIKASKGKIRIVDLARQFNVERSAIERIYRGIHWTHV